jgi:DNA-binding transcriptional regulator YhcF (GntR family)
MTSLNARVSNTVAVKSAVGLWYQDHRYGPSFRDLAKLTGLSLGTVYNVCQELREDGVLEFEDNVARTIKIKESSNEQI